MSLGTPIPTDQLVDKIGAGTAFQATAAQATLTANQGLLTAASSQFFTDAPGSSTFPTLQPQFVGSPQADLLTQLGQQMALAGTGLSAFASHIEDQLTALPNNMRIFASHSDLLSQTGPVNCDTELGKFFGSILNGARDVVQSIGAVFSAITGAIALAGGALAWVETQLAASFSLIQQALSSALGKLTTFISNEIATIEDAIGKLIRQATAGLFPSLFKNDCLAQLMSDPSPTNPNGAGNGIIIAPPNTFTA
jgi:hypothetical protein